MARHCTVLHGIGKLSCTYDIQPVGLEPTSDVTLDAKVITNLGRSSAVGLWKWPGLSEAGQGFKC